MFVGSNFGYFYRVLIGLLHTSNVQTIQRIIFICKNGNLWFIFICDFLFRDVWQVLDYLTLTGVTEREDDHPLSIPCPLLQNRYKCCIPVPIPDSHFLTLNSIILYYWQWAQGKVLFFEGWWFTTIDYRVCSFWKHLN